MRLDVQEDVQAARRAVAIARLALARQANPHAVVHPGRDRDRQPPGHAHALLPAAVRAGRRRDLAFAVAARARGDADELAQDRLLRPAHLARAVALRAADRLGARLGAAALAAGHVSSRGISISFSAPKTASWKVISMS